MDTSELKNVDISNISQNISNLDAMINENPSVKDFVNKSNPKRKKK